MKISTKLRVISLVMLFVANIFVACALANQALGRTFYIGSTVIIGAAFFLAFEMIVCTGLIISKIKQ